MTKKINNLLSTIVYQHTLDLLSKSGGKETCTIFTLSETLKDFEDILSLDRLFETNKNFRQEFSASLNTFLSERDLKFLVTLPTNSDTEILVLINPQFPITFGKPFDFGLEVDYIVGYTASFIEKEFRLNPGRNYFFFGLLSILRHLEEREPEKAERLIFYLESDYRNFYSLYQKKLTKILDSRNIIVEFLNINSVSCPCAFKKSLSTVRRRKLVF